ncbi:hypothetical protein COY28_04325 [Candidatus Woesearchaeota archaeon CG_4_10_14_0_2_um_filter_57_5]|nr:MAG: hypothetical protein COY28_04325 [Candidatus Woesearchaeota archaeon CG_4_10_14_0_2_um_filter_57_5]
MHNEFIWLLMLIFNFTAILLAYKWFGRTGLYAWTAVAVIIANIQVLKIVPLFGLVTAEGNIIYSSTFLATDILSEKYGKKEARKAVWIGFFTLISATILLQLTLLMTPHASDTMSGPLSQVFSVLPRIAFASLIAYLLSQLHDIWAFEAIRKRLPDDKWLWVRNNGSTVVSQLIDNTVFTLIAFWGVLPWGIIGQIFITSYILKFAIAALDTPFIYLAKRMKPAPE